MAYNEALAGRIRTMVARRRSRKKIVEKVMFGGHGFLLNGNVCCGTFKRYLIVRLGEKRAKAALTEPHTKVFDITGRVMKAWAMVGPKGYADDNDLKRWVGGAIRFASTLPPK